MQKILFQGDSITDCGRNKENDINKGNGYPNLIAARMGFEHPGKYEFINRGISGNRVTDLYARIKRDVLNLNPDYISILIGVNDVWHEFERQDGVDENKFEKVYDMLIVEIKESLPKTKIMILEPFVTQSTATENNWEVFSKEVVKRADASRRVAEKNNLIFVPLQKKFDEMLSVNAEPYWTLEGIHPTSPGHELIAREWMTGFMKL